MVTDARLRGNIAIAGIGFSPLSRNSGKSVGALALIAARAAIADAGLRPQDVDGVGGVFSLDQPTVGPGAIVEGLGIPSVTWTNGGTPPSILPVIEGALAVFGGLCRYALIVHAKYRWDTTSKGAAGDPLRQSPFRPSLDPAFTGQYLRPYRGLGGGMQAGMRRHMYQFGSRREHFGMIAVNNRTNALKNERAVFKSPITMEDYMNAPMIIDPFCILDMDMPIDGAMAVVLTSRERAADLPRKPVYIESASMATTARNNMAFNYPLEYQLQAQELVGEQLWGASGLKPADIDVANIYDGFTVLTMFWIEGALCGRGNGAAFLEESWREEEQRLLFWGRVPMSTHGGNLSEGRLQGFGHLLEAVQQLRGEAGIRQVPDARVALVTNGLNGFCGGMILRAD